MLNANRERVTSRDNKQKNAPRNHVGADALVRPAERSSAILRRGKEPVELRLTGRTSSGPPTWFTAGACRIIFPMAAVPEPSLILSFAEARHLVEDHAEHLRPRGKELVELLEAAAAGQVLGGAHIR